MRFTRITYLFVFLLLGSAICLQSCTDFFFKDVDLPVDIKEPEMVMEVYARNDTGYSVNMRQTRPLYNSSVKTYYLDKAIVYIIHKGDTFPLPFTENYTCPFCGGFIPQSDEYSIYSDTSKKFIIGESYTAVAEYSGKKVMGEFSIPPLPPDFTWELDSVLSDDEYNRGMMLYHVTLKWERLPDDDNYYFARVNNMSGIAQFWSDFITTPDHVNGNQISIRLPLNYQKGINGYSWGLLLSEYEIELYKVSKAFYEYHLSFTKQNSGSGGFAEPIQIKSNIINGIGIASGYSLRKKTIKVK